MKFKRIYIEISNICNLNCSFCSKDGRPIKIITSSEFEEIIKKINNYTDYIYLHVKGEPLIHPELDKILSISSKYNKKVCLTTNGVFLKEKINILKKYDNIHQINISLHSENNKQNYLEDIFEATGELNCYISFRFWTLDQDKMNEKTLKLFEKIKEKYHKDKLEDKMSLSDKTYLSLDEEFEWPRINNEYESDGYCLGGKNQLAILSSGTVVICCLDSEGRSNLGNIHKDSFESILASPKYKETIKSFQNNKCYLPICRCCTYKERFKK